MSNYLETIKARIKELDPEKYQEMKLSGEMGLDLDEYRERIASVRGEAARAARKLADQAGMNVIELAQQMNMAARMAEEIEMAEVMDELQNLYGPTTESQTETS